MTGQFLSPKGTAIWVVGGYGEETIGIYAVPFGEEGKNAGIYAVPFGEKT
jgi:hypothetical protein